MLAKIVGIENKEFKIDDKSFKGQQLYFTCHNDKTEGVQTGKVFATNGEYKLNDQITILYSKKYKKLFIKK